MKSILNFINFHEKYIKFYVHVLNTLNFMYTNILFRYKYIKFNVMS